jgi:hypothetical protein
VKGTEKRGGEWVARRMGEWIELKSEIEIPKSEIVGRR